MRRLKKNIFYGLCASTVAVLALVRAACPEVTGEMTANANVGTSTETAAADTLHTDVRENETTVGGNGKTVTKNTVTAGIVTAKPATYHPVRSVYSYDKCFPDVQDVQIEAARKWGVKPVKNREEAELRKEDLVYVGANPFYCVDKGMRRSIPYLVPRASNLLQTIGRNFLDSLFVKGIPLHRIIVSSVLRTDEDVAHLLRSNPNANEQSCHRFGTTVDIAYNRYSTVSHPDGPVRRTVQNDTLKWVLSEVLRDLRESGRCYIKYEKKQGCFHITTR